MIISTFLHKKLTIFIIFNLISRRQIMKMLKLTSAFMLNPGTKSYTIYLPVDFVFYSNKIIKWFKNLVNFGNSSIEIIPRKISSVQTKKFILKSRKNFESDMVRTIRWLLQELLASSDHKTYFYDVLLSVFSFKLFLCCFIGRFLQIGITHIVSKALVLSCYSQSLHYAL